MARSWISRYSRISSSRRARTVNAMRSIVPGGARPRPGSVPSRDRACRAASAWLRHTLQEAIVDHGMQRVVSRNLRGVSQNVQGPVGMSPPAGVTGPEGTFRRRTLDAPESHQRMLGVFLRHPESFLCRSQSLQGRGEIPGLRRHRPLDAAPHLLFLRGGIGLVQMIDYESGRSHSSHDSPAGHASGKPRNVRIAPVAPFMADREGEREQWHEDLQSEHKHGVPSIRAEAPRWSVGRRADLAWPRTLHHRPRAPLSPADGLTEIGDRRMPHLVIQATIVTRMSSVWRLKVGQCLDIRSPALSARGVRRPDEARDRRDGKGPGCRDVQEPG